MTVQSFLFGAMEFMAALFIMAVGIVFLAIVVVYILDISQTQQAIRRNYPVIGHFRYLFEHLGEFFRQYFFAMDREELPFNRAQRSWIYRAAKNLDNTVAFGSTRDLRLEFCIKLPNSSQFYQEKVHEYVTHHFQFHTINSTIHRNLWPL